jgi:glucose/arabinose dehydrogenase
MLTRRLARFTAVVSLALPNLGAQTQLTTVRVAGGFRLLTYVTTAPGDRERIFVTERDTGRVHILRNGTTNPVPFLDVGSRIVAGGERGLLGLAFHPNHQQNGYFYVSYTRVGDGASILERFQRVTADIADPNSGVVMYGPVAQPNTNHNGGGIQFGPDGYLYLGLGDGGFGGFNPACHAQDPGIALGKMLRLDMDDPISRVPPSNPFVGNPAYLPEIWALGLRNPWRWSFDRRTGDLWIADVGQDQWEEVNFAPSSGGGENYGWKAMEGPSCYSTLNCAPGVPGCNHPDLTLPIWSYSHVGGCSITGGYRYRGAAIPDLDGWYFCADWCSNRIMSLRIDGGAVTQVVDRTGELAPATGSIRSISSFGEDWDGEILIATAGGVVWKIVPRSESPARDLGFGTLGGNGQIPRYEVLGSTAAGNTAQCWIRSAAVSAPAAVLFSARNNPTNVAPFGTLVPFPIDFSLVFTTNTEGEVSFTIPGGLPATTLFSQWAVVDAGNRSGIALSNAVEIVYP